MEYWHDILKRYDDPESNDPGKKNHGVYSQSSAVILLLYLAFGEDYGYNIMNYFKNNLMNYNHAYFCKESEEMEYEPRTKRYPSNLTERKVYTLLIRMKKDELVIARDGIGERKPAIIYSINPLLLHSLTKGEPYLRDGSSSPKIPLVIVNKILPLRNLKWKKGISFSARDGFFNFVRFSERINFSTFVQIIREWVYSESQYYDDLAPYTKLLDKYSNKLDILVGEHNAYRSAVSLSALYLIEDMSARTNRFVETNSREFQLD